MVACPGPIFPAPRTCSPAFVAIRHIVVVNDLDRTLMADYAQPDTGGILSRALSWAGGSGGRNRRRGRGFVDQLSSVRGVERVTRGHRRHEYRHDIFHRQGGSPPCPRPGLGLSR